MTRLQRQKRHALEAVDTEPYLGEGEVLTADSFPSRPTVF